MPRYGGLALHANNSVVVLLNEQEQVIYQRRFSKSTHDSGAIRPLSSRPQGRGGGRAERVKHRTRADAQMGGNGMARPSLLTQRPHLLMALDNT
jgi:hypothetical protein